MEFFHPPTERDRLRLAVGELSAASSSRELYAGVWTAARTAEAARTAASAWPHSSAPVWARSAASTNPRNAGASARTTWPALPDATRPVTHVGEQERPFVVVRAAVINAYRGFLALAHDAHDPARALPTKSGGLTTKPGAWRLRADRRAALRLLRRLRTRLRLRALGRRA